MNLLLRYLSPLPIFIFIIICGLSSCSHEQELYLPGEAQSGASVRIFIDWKEFLHRETPTGMTIVLFQHGDSLIKEGKQCYHISSKTTNNTAWEDFYLLPAKYTAYVFNQSQSEFGTLSFANLDDWDLAEVTAKSCTSKWYTAKKIQAISADIGLDSTNLTKEPLVNSVEWLGTASKDILLTQEMIDSASVSCLTLDTLHVKNIVYTVTVYVHIKNIGSLRSARASIQGLAHGYKLGTHSPCEKKATQLLDKWSLKIDSTSTDSKTKCGTIKAQIATLGLPQGHNGKPTENILHLECLLRNDSIMTFNYPVGDRFKNDSNDNKDLNLTIDITMKDPLPNIPTYDDNASAFDVTVDDWGDEQCVFMPV